MVSCVTSVSGKWSGTAVKPASLGHMQRCPDRMDGRTAPVASTVPGTSLPGSSSEQRRTNPNDLSGMFGGTQDRRKRPQQESVEQSIRMDPKDPAPAQSTTSVKPPCPQSTRPEPVSEAEAMIRSRLEPRMDRISPVLVQALIDHPGTSNMSLGELDRFLKLASLQAKHWQAAGLSPVDAGLVTAGQSEKIDWQHWSYCPDFMILIRTDREARADFLRYRLLPAPPKALYDAYRGAESSLIHGPYPDIEVHHGWPRAQAYEKAHAAIWPYLPAWKEATLQYWDYFFTGCDKAKVNEIANSWDLQIILYENSNFETNYGNHSLPDAEQISKIRNKWFYCSPDQFVRMWMIRKLAREGYEVKKPASPPPRPMMPARRVGMHNCPPLWQRRPADEPPSPKAGAFCPIKIV